MHAAEFTVTVSGQPGLPAWEKSLWEDFSTSTDSLLSFFLAVFAFTLQTVEDVAPDRMDLDALLVMRV